MIKGKIWTVSNGLSLSRIVLMIPAAYYLYTPVHFHREIAVFIVLVAIVTDALDGYLARRLNQISEVGKIIDPLADKFGAAIMVVMLAIFGDIPVWFMVVVLVRDIIIFLAGLYLTTKTGIILPSMFSGKLAVAFLAFTLVLAMLHYAALTVYVDVMVLCTVALLGFSILVYARRFLKTLKQFSSTH